MGVAKAALEATSPLPGARPRPGRHPRQPRVRRPAGDASPRAASRASASWPTRWREQAPLGWDTSDPEPVAGAISFLLSDLARGITGQVLKVDGGYSAVGAPVTAEAPRRSGPPHDGPRHRRDRLPGRLRGRPAGRGRPGRRVRRARRASRRSACDARCGRCSASSACTTCAPSRATSSAGPLRRRRRPTCARDRALRGRRALRPRRSTTRARSTSRACGRSLELARKAPALERFVHVSTAYVGGTHTGRFDEDDLDVGQGFRNTYEQSKFEAEQVVRASGLPVRVVRPSIVVGESTYGLDELVQRALSAAAGVRPRARRSGCPPTRRDRRRRAGRPRGRRRAARPARPARVRRRCTRWRATAR